VAFHKVVGVGGVEAKQSVANRKQQQGNRHTRLRESVLVCLLFSRAGVSCKLPSLLLVVLCWLAPGVQRIVSCARLLLLFAG
jgi:hypothetical protein